MRQSHGDSTMIVRPPFDVSMFESAVLCYILFYTFEVPSQLKIRSCTLLVHKFPKIHEDHTATVRSQHGLSREAARAPCDFYARLGRQHNYLKPQDLLTISARSVYGFARVSCGNPSKKSYDGHINVNT